MPRLDPLAKAFAQVRDATTLNPKLSTAEAVGVLEQVKFEILRDAQMPIDKQLAEDRIGG